MKRWLFRAALSLIAFLLLSSGLFFMAQWYGVAFFRWLNEIVPPLQPFKAEAEELPPTPMPERPWARETSDLDAIESLLLRPDSEPTAETRTPKQSALTRRSAVGQRGEQKGKKTVTEPVTDVESVGPRSVISKKLLSAWAERRLFPQLSYRSATGKLPAGLELLNGAAYGVGLLQGDRLIAIDGQSVSSPVQAAGIILSARGVKAESISGKVARISDSKLEIWVMNFHQPYGKELPVSLRPADDAKPADVDSDGNAEK